MRLSFPALLALTAGALAPAHAQQKVVRTDYGFSYTIPAGYHQDPEPTRVIRVDSPIGLLSDEATTTRTLEDTATQTTNLVILSAMRLYILPAAQTIRMGGASASKQADEESAIDEPSARRFIEAFNQALKPTGTNLDYQRSALIKIAGEPAAAIRCNASSQRLSEYFTARLILLPHDGKMYLFAFGALNGEFDEKVVAFDRFMTSFKFLKAAAPPLNVSPAKPKAKPTPKPKTKK